MGLLLQQVSRSSREERRETLQLYWLERTIVGCHSLNSSVQSFEFLFFLAVLFSCTSVRLVILLSRSIYEYASAKTVTAQKIFVLE